MKKTTTQIKGLDPNIPMDCQKHKMMINFTQKRRLYTKNNQVNIYFYYNNT